MKRKGAYVPERGDAVWITLDPQAGHEQAGRRPALVLSPSVYNGRVGLALLCPITSQVKGYPFEVPLPNGAAGSGCGGGRPSEKPGLAGTQSDPDRCCSGRSRRSGRDAASDIARITMLKAMVVGASGSGTCRAARRPGRSSNGRCAPIERLPTRDLARGVLHADHLAGSIVLVAAEHH